MSEVDQADAFSDIDEKSLDPSETSANKYEVETDKYGFVGGKEYTNPEYEKISVAKIRKSEMKWLEMLDSWDKWMSKKFAKVKKRCRKGIPSSLRGRAWQLLCGSKNLQDQNKDVFQKLLRAEAAARIMDEIDRDLHRQFPFHEMFRQKGGSGQQDLRDVLYAYSIYNPRDGYCQAQAPIAAVLLMHMPAEEAFWCMAAIFEYYIPGYFSPGLEAVQIDGSVMQGILRHVSPVAYKHLEQQQVSPMLYCTEWFMCIFSRTLPWPCVLRLWDMFFCEGVKVVFRCALVILKNAIGKPEVVKQLPGMYETLNCVKHFDLKDIEPDVLMNEVVEIKVAEEDLEHEHKQQLKKHKLQKSGTNSLPRTYKHTTVKAAKKSSDIGSNLKTKKQLNAISVNSSLIMEQALEQENNRKKRSSPSTFGRSLTLFRTPQHTRRHSDTFAFNNGRLSRDNPGKLAASTLCIPEATDLDHFKST